MADPAVRSFLRQIVAALARQTPAFAGSEQSRPPVIRALGRSSPAYSASDEEAEWQRLVEQLGDSTTTLTDPPTEEPPTSEPPPEDPAAESETYYRHRGLVVSRSFVEAGGRRFAVSSITGVALLNRGRRIRRLWPIAVFALPLLAALVTWLTLRQDSPTWLWIVAVATALTTLVEIPYLVAVLRREQVVEVWIRYRDVPVRLTQAVTVPEATRAVRSIKHVIRLSGENASV
ncbi:hypothetical protein ACGFJ7_44100 [Actinoplanes sp. NPDC048988]|uniref:hypothetical protein n=1 Tax=Actinoplanes sp. NPDC048988 TaxID=3363901 RepID=UPI0037236AA5